MANNVIQLENLTRTYVVGETEVRALRGVSLNVPAGDFLAMAATLMQVKSRLLLPPDERAAEEEEDPDAFPF